MFKDNSCQLNRQLTSISPPKNDPKLDKIIKKYKGVKNNKSRDCSRLLYSLPITYGL